MSEGHKKKNNIWTGDRSSNHCHCCHKRIRDWKQYCNQICFDKQMTIEQLAFEKAEDDDRYNSLYLTECDRWIDHDGYDGEVDHPSKWNKWRESCSDEDHEHPKFLRCEEESLENSNFSELKKD